jgi:glycosyltransferase involved in cell wall biosynthesis
VLASPVSTADRLHVLVVEPYLGGSHAAWVDGLRRHSRHRVTVVSHPANFWRWRMQGAALTLASGAEEAVATAGRPDIVLATDMMHLPAFLGFTRRTLGHASVALYLHESQLLYPDAPDPRGRPARGRPAEARERLGQVNWQSMAAADHVFFNSRSHLDALRAELPHLLSRAPDASHLPYLDAVLARCSVLPVGFEVDELVRAPRPAPDGGPPIILWNQRWDHDKQPRLFFAALRQLADDGVDFRLALAGHNERVDPREFTEAIGRFGDRIVGLRPPDRKGYLDLLLRSDIVVSTAAQETFGIAVVEALAAGCVPVLPARLSYPEIVGARHEHLLYGEGALLGCLRDAMERLPERRVEADELRREMARFSWTELGPRYDTALADLRAGCGN